MLNIEPDARSASRRAQDEAIASESPSPIPDVSPGAVFQPVEALLSKSRRHPLALSGVVENGMIRLIDPGVTLPERSRVIVVAQSD